MVYEPDILLLDEPLSSLDNPRKDTLLQMLQELKETQQHTFLYVTHDDREIVQLADTVAVLDRGVILQQGTVDELRKYPADPIVSEIFKVRSNVAINSKGEQL